MIVIFFSEKSGERKVEYIINNKKINDIFKNTQLYTLMYQKSKFSNS